MWGISCRTAFKLLKSHSKLIALIAVVIVGLSHFGDLKMRIVTHLQGGFIHGAVSIGS